MGHIQSGKGAMFEMVDHVGNEKSVKYGTANSHYDISADYFHHSFSES